MIKVGFGKSSMGEHEVSFSEDVFCTRAEGDLWIDPDIRGERVQRGERPVDPGDAVVVLEEIINRGISLGMGIKGKAEALVNLHSQVRFVLHGTRLAYRL